MDGKNVAPRLMPLLLLQEITNGFSNDRKVGSGSYGNVYKGEHKNGHTIAVKVLRDNPGLDDKQFKKEYINIASLQHKNIVRLVGYCHETQEKAIEFNGKLVFAEMTKRALCFEYMHNGSLEKYLSDEFNGHDWRTRYAIIKGICQGLKYLHEELQHPMFHLDIKPANILLDENLLPKIADFGLSRILGGEQTHMSKSSIGTHGYIPPEYIEAGIISNKFDVFSLGAVFIKIIAGPAGYNMRYDMSSEEFTQIVHANWMKRLHEGSLHQMDSYSEQVKKCIEIALRCGDGDRHKRPSIGEIVAKLNETETMTQSPDEDIGSSICKICHCISIESELMMDTPLQKLSSFPLHVTDNKGRLHQTIVSTICQPEDNNTLEEPICPSIKIMDCMRTPFNTYTIDVHPTEPWILVCDRHGKSFIWNHQTQAPVMEFDNEYEDMVLLRVGRFIPRKQLLVAGDDRGLIHVYTYMTKDKVMAFKAHTGEIKSLAVHPNDPFVLSSSHREIKLWNWENGWVCTRTFQGHNNEVESVKFNPLTARRTFASASRDGTVKIWSMFSDSPITTLECGMARLSSFDYLIAHGNKEYIVAGSYCGTAHIWDLVTRSRIRCIEGFNGVSFVDWLPGNKIMVTVSRDEKVSFCNSTHRYRTMVDFNMGYILATAYIKGTRSLVVTGRDGIAIMTMS